MHNYSFQSPEVIPFGVVDNCICKMFDVSLSSAGAKIALATSYDEEYPPENIIDGSNETFWPTTGLFPHEFVISFDSLMSIGLIRLTCSNVKEMCVQKSSKSDPVDFELLVNREFENNDGQLQVDEIKIPVTPASHLRFLITSGHNHFISIHKVSVDGVAIH